MFGAPPKLLNYQDARRIATELNYGVMKFSDEGPVPVPRDAKYVASSQDFSREWHRILLQYAGLNNRPVQVSAYQRMDQYSPLVSRALDTYADESLGINGTFLPSISFNINDKTIEEKVRKVVELNDLFTNTKVRADVRDLCKYGDVAYVFSLYRSNMPLEIMKLFENISVKQNKIDVAFAPEEIIITDVSPTHYSLNGYRNQLYQLTTDVNNQQTYLPWEFVVMSLEDKDLFPYGRSMIEQGRICFETLQIAEQLLAMARASKVSRWVIKIPSGADPMSDFDTYEDLRTSFENMRWNGGGMGGNSGGGPNGTSPFMTRPSDLSLNTIFFVPNNIEFSELRIPIDVSDWAA